MVSYCVHIFLRFVRSFICSERATHWRFGENVLGIVSRYTLSALSSVLLSAALFHICRDDDNDDDDDDDDGGEVGGDRRR